MQCCPPFELFQGSLNLTIFLPQILLTFCICKEGRHIDFLESKTQKTCKNKHANHAEPSCMALYTVDNFEREYCKQTTQLDSVKIQLVRSQLSSVVKVNNTFKLCGKYLKMYFCIFFGIFWHVFC